MGDNNSLYLNLVDIMTYNPRYILTATSMLDQVFEKFILDDDIFIHYSIKEHTKVTFCSLGLDSNNQEHDKDGKLR